MSITIVDENNEFRTIQTEHIQYLMFRKGSKANRMTFYFRVVFVDENVTFYFENINNAITSANKLKDVEVLDELGYKKSLYVIFEYFEDRFGEVMKDKKTKYVSSCLEDDKEESSKEPEEDEDENENIDFDEVVEDLIYEHL